MGIRFGVGCVVLLALLAVPAWGQTGSLEVRVIEGATDAPLPGATVTLSNDRGLLRPTSEITNAEGIAAFPVLRVGSGYLVEISAAGFAGQRHGSLRVNAGRTNALVVQLSPEVRETVQVRAERGVVDLDHSGSSSKFDNDFIDNLPVQGRVYQNILTLAPGVKDADGDGNPNVHGSRKSDFRALVGGVSNTDPLTGEYLSFVNFESIEEIEIHHLRRRC